MIKKIIIPALLLIPLAGCASDPRDTQCDKEKNYILKNPSALDNYLKLKKEGHIDGIYIEFSDLLKCSYLECMKFPESFKYVEMKMIYKGKEGIYKITRDYNLKNPKCIEENSSRTKRRENYCYIVEENNKGEIYSNYHYIYDGKGIQKTIFKNIKSNEVLFEDSYQVYSVNYIGAVGGGSCPYQYDNHPEYQFNIFSVIN